MILVGSTLVAPFAGAVFPNVAVCIIIDSEALTDVSATLLFGLAARTASWLCQAPVVKTINRRIAVRNVFLTITTILASSEYCLFLHFQFSLRTLEMVAAPRSRRKPVQPLDRRTV